MKRRLLVVPNTTTTTTMEDNNKKKEEEEEEEEDRFREVFKYYKRRKPPPDLTDVIDVDSCNEVKEVQCLPTISDHNKAVAREAGLTPPHTWTVHSLVKHPGLLIVRNPFTLAGQLMWASRCLRDIPTPANRTNLSSHGIQLKDRTWWQLCRTKEGVRSKLKQKLRWVTLGYHHDWDTKEYSENNRGEMPECVVRLCGAVVGALSLCGGGGDGGGGAFQAQAAIINYYHHQSTLAPHTDHSEPYMEAPLLSFSFGQSAVFLIGGATKATAPTPVLLHSGDIVVMSGAARLCYHAVPRILLREERRRRKEEEEEEPWETQVDKDERKESRKFGMLDKELGMEDKELGMQNNESGMEAKELRMENKELGMKDKKLGMENKELGMQNKETGIEKQDKQEEQIKTRKMEGKNNKDKNQKTTKQTTQHWKNEKSELQQNTNKNNDNNNDDDDDDDDDLPDILHYLRTCRINMNIRQVLPPSIKTLPL